MKFEATTIKDIAKALGLSTSTVSRALTDSYQISPETKQLVLECARKMNYRPNPIALSLKEKRSRSIGIVVSEIANSFFSQAINGIESIAHEKGYNVIITQSHESCNREAMNLQYLASRSVDGLIISVSTESNDIAHIKALHDRGLPIVFFDRVAEDIHTHQVIVDNFKGAYEGTRHLLQNGYRHIAIISNAGHLSISKERLAGYEKALLDHPLPIRSSLLKHCSHGGLIVQELEKSLDALLRLKQRPDAIFAATDKITIGCLRILKARGIRVPEDIALVGFSNTDKAELLCPPLTVVKQPAFEMGEIATDLLLKMIESKRPPSNFDKIVLTPQLIVSESSQPRP